MKVDGHFFHHRAILALRHVYRGEFEDLVARDHSFSDANRTLIRRHWMEINEITKLVQKDPELGYKSIARMHLGRKAEERSRR